MWCSCLQGAPKVVHSGCNSPSRLSGCIGKESSREGALRDDHRRDGEVHVASGTSSLVSGKPGEMSQPNLCINKDFLRASRIPKPLGKEKEQRVTRNKHGVSVQKLLTRSKDACIAWRTPQRPKESQIPLRTRKSVEVRTQSSHEADVSNTKHHSLRELRLENDRPSSFHSQPCTPAPVESLEATQSSGEFLMSTQHIHATISDEELFTKGDLESFLHSGSGHSTPVGRCIRSVVERLLDVESIDDKTPGTWLYEARDVSDDQEKTEGPSSNVPWIRDIATISEVVGSADEADPQPSGTADEQDFQAVDAGVDGLNKESWGCVVDVSEDEIQGLGTERDHHSRSVADSPPITSNRGSMQHSLGSWASSSTTTTITSSSSFSSPSGTSQQNTPASSPIAYKDALDTVLARACNQSNLMSLDYESVFIEELSEPCWSSDECADSECKRRDEDECGFFGLEDTAGSSVLEWSFASPRSDAANHNNKDETCRGDNVAAPLSYEDCEPRCFENAPRIPGIQTSGEESVSEMLDCGFRPLLLECLWSCDVSFSDRQGITEGQGGECVSELVDSLSAYVNTCGWPKDVSDNTGPATDNSGLNLAIGSYMPDILWSSESSEDEDDLLCDDFCSAERSIGLCASMRYIDEFSFANSIECQHQKTSQMLVKSVTEQVRGGVLSWPANSTGVLPGSAGYESMSTYSLSVRDWIMSTCSLMTNKDITSAQTLSSSCASSLPCFTEIHIVDGYKFSGNNPLWIAKSECDHEEVQRLEPVCEGEYALKQLKASGVSDDEKDSPKAGGSTFRSDTTDGILSQWAGAVGREMANISDEEHTWYSPPKMGFASRLVRTTSQSIGRKTVIK